MTNSPTNSPKRMTKAQHDQFVDLVFRYFDGLLDVQDIAKLNDILRNTPEARQLFTSYSQERFVLRDVLLASREEVDASSVLAELAAAEERAGEGQIVDLTDELERRKLKKHQEVAAENRWRLGLQKNDSPQAGLHQYVIPKLVAGLGVAALIGLVVWLGLDKTPPSRDASFADGTDSSMTETVTPPVTPPAIVATIRDSVDAQWVGQDDPNDFLREGQVVTLSSGFAEIVFGSGATMIVEGPATFEMIDANAFSLTRGRIAATVPEPAKGFEVRTPHGNVVDLGTEFGVEVLADQATQVAVFTGLVEIHSNAPDVSTSDPVRLEAGRQAQLSQDADHAVVMAELDVETSAVFAKTMDDAASSAFHYRRIVLADSPIMYWGFGDAESESLTSAVRPQDELVLHGSATLESQGDEHWLRLEGRSEEPSFAELPGIDTGLRGAAEYTLECWVRPRTLQQGPLISYTVYAQRSFNSPSGALLQIHSKATDDEGRTARFVHRNPPAIEGPSSASSTEAYEHGRWIHLVAVKTRGEMQLYMDGKLVGVEADTTSMASEALRLRLGYLLTDEPTSRQFEGDMDEVAVYDTALSADQILNHYQSGQAWLED